MVALSGGPMSSRSRTRGELRREEIRKAAYRCFQKAGYHETTVDDICAAAGLSKGSFYWSYTSKQEVFIDILETWAREVMDELHEQFEASVHQADYVNAISAALERETSRGRQIVPLWLEFNTQARKDEEIRVSLAKFYRRARTAIAEILRPVSAERLSEDELQATAAAIFGAFAGLIMQDLSDPGGIDTPSVMRHVVKLVGERFRNDKAAGPTASQD